jgi:nucleotide-binding universal stress UspA family protein
MPTFVVATDFSTRSDRALRRATLLARAHCADLLLVHVIDDDQPAAIIDAHRDQAELLLDHLEQTISQIDQLGCRYQVRFGEPFEQVPVAARDAKAALLILGPHRRQVLRDQFRGTTAERTIRRSSVPVLVANALPSASYERVLLTSDLEPASAGALKTAADMPLLEASELILLYVYDRPAREMLGRTLATGDEFERYEQHEAVRAASKLEHFRNSVGLNALRALVRPRTGSIESAVLAASQQVSADLIVVTAGQKGFIGAVMLGSVTEGILRDSDQDVLVWPRRGKEVSSSSA